jgi:hypothetical protein
MRTMRARTEFSMGADLLRGVITLYYRLKGGQSPAAKTLAPNGLELSGPAKAPSSEIAELAGSRRRSWCSSRAPASG